VAVYTNRVHPVAIIVYRQKECPPVHFVLKLSTLKQKLNRLVIAVRVVIGPIEHDANLHFVKHDILFQVKLHDIFVLVCYISDLVVVEPSLCSVFVLIPRPALVRGLDIALLIARPYKV
jgi:hypothetical protein